MIEGMFIKICGLRTVADVEAAAAAGADAMGVVLSSSSPRAVAPEQAHELVAAAARRLTTVLVVHDVTIEEAIDRARQIGVDVLQLHGYSEAADRLAARELPRTWRAVAATAGRAVVGEHGEEALLLDSPTPGSGQRWDLADLDARPQGRWLLAGGLSPDNVAAAIRGADPWGVDVSSGVEATRGTKDHDLIHRFVAAARSV